MRDRGVQRLEVSADRRQLPSRCEDPRPGDAAGLDRVPQGDVAVDAGVSEVAHGGEARLQVLARQLRAEQDALRGRLGGHRQEEPRLECRVPGHLRLRRNDHVEQQMRVRIDHARHQCRRA